MEWQPIETAPKNESILLCIGGKIVVGHWKLNWSQWREGFLHDDLGSLPMPSHWMPLPNPTEGN